MLGLGSSNTAFIPITKAEQKRARLREVELTIRLCVHPTDPPEFATVTTQYTKLKGETVTLACPASASPAPTTVVWYKDNVQLTVTGRYSGGTLSTPALTISSLTGTDSGDFFCRVTNSLGTADSSNMNLDVQCECLRLGCSGVRGLLTRARALAHTHTHTNTHQKKKKEEKKKKRFLHFFKIKFL